VIEAFHIVHSEMPSALWTLKYALKHLGNDNGTSLEPGNTGAGPSSTDTPDCEFVMTRIDALRRLSKGTDLGLPSWTITWFEVDLGPRVGFGFFSEVFRGTWRKHTVAIKVLDKTAPRKTFLREMEIWKSLHHPNVLKLLARPARAVCKYYSQGNLVNYLNGSSKSDAAKNDAVKMIYEISKSSMVYLHKRGVLHGDLKAANILVDDDMSCVISDFSQREMKSEVYRLTRTPRPRGTLRWQAPELMEGTQTLKPAMDVYAFAICCWEILDMGALPWPLSGDSTIRHLVLKKK